jgi:hypothetical protein
MHANTNCFSGKWLILYMDSSIHRIRNEESITKSKGSDVTGKSPTNITTDKEIASRMANLLEGLEFPATKAKIKDHVNNNKITERLPNLEEVLEIHDKHIFHDYISLTSAYILAQIKMNSTACKYLLVTIFI